MDQAESLVRPLLEATCLRRVCSSQAMHRVALQSEAPRSTRLRLTVLDQGELPVTVRLATPARGTQAATPLAGIRNHTYTTWAPALAHQQGHTSHWKNITKILPCSKGQGGSRHARTTSVLRRSTTRTVLRALPAPLSLRPAPPASHVEHGFLEPGVDGHKLDGAAAP